MLQWQRESEKEENFELRVERTRLEPNICQQGLRKTSTVCLVQEKLRASCREVSEGGVCTQSFVFRKAFFIASEGKDDLKLTTLVAKK